MIKKIMTLMVALALPFFTIAADFSEGKEFTKISEEVTSKPEVREYFSFYCPHCFSFETFFAKVKKGLPADVSFERNHVDFLRFTTPEIQFMLSKALVAAQQMNEEEKITAALFNYIQVQRATIASEKDIRNVFVVQGVDGAEFDKLFNSFTVNSLAKKMQKNQNDLLAKRALTGVPTVVVNGKYRINADKLGSNPEQKYNDLIAYLLTLK